MDRRSVSRVLWTTVLLCACTSPRPARAKDEATKPGPCPLEQALAKAGLTVDDLGYRPPAHFARYPHPETTPHVMPFFEDLFARPLDTYEFTRTLGNVVEDELTPQALTAQPKKPGTGETLFRLGVSLATERRIGGFRRFKVNLPPKAPKEAPLQKALAKWGVEDVAEVADLVPGNIRRALALTLLELHDAKIWIDRGLRRVTPKQRSELYRLMPDTAEHTPDGTQYDSVVDDIADVVDEHSLWYGCLKALQSSQNTRRRLAALNLTKMELGLLYVTIPTLAGPIVLSNIPTKGAPKRAPLLWIHWQEHPMAPRSPLGATDATRNLSVAVLMPPLESSKDSSEPESTPPMKEESTTSHESRPVARGVLGCGIVYAAGDVSQQWASSSWGLGAGFFGLGALIDEGGNDTYEIPGQGQGAAFFGAGLLLDAAGDDSYNLRKGDGQGFGGPNGIGILADRSGNDRYYSEPLASKAGRADYHSKNKIAVSNAQGVGSGRRGDISDGHNWAGGLGALIDVDGDDHYVAGNFSQGLGYWYGTGLMWDGGGDDKYHSVYFTQGSGAHFAIGALIDEGGNDEHILSETGGAGLAFGWDLVNAILIDRGNGNDRYEAKKISIGVAEVRSNAIFIDEGGDDVYVMNAKGKGFGDVDDRASYKKPRRDSVLHFRLPQAALFMDLGGSDTYLRRPKPAKDAKPDDPAKEDTADKLAGDGRTWHLRAKDEHALGGFNCCVAVDGEMNANWLGFLRAWPRRVGVK